MKRLILAALASGISARHQHTHMKQKVPVNRKPDMPPRTFGQDDPKEQRINRYPEPRMWACYSACHPDVEAAGTCADTSCNFCPWPYKFVAGDPDNYKDNDRCEERHLCERIRWYFNRNKYGQIAQRKQPDKKKKRCPVGFQHRPMWYSTEVDGSNQEELCCKKECYSRDHLVTQPCSEEAGNVLLKNPIKQFWKADGNDDLQCTYNICDLLDWPDSEEGSDFCCQPDQVKEEKLAWLALDLAKIEKGVKFQQRKGGVNAISLSNYRK